MLLMGLIFAHFSLILAHETKSKCKLFITLCHFPKVGTKVDDYWEPGKALLQDPGKFLEGLFKYDKVRCPYNNATIPPTRVKRVLEL